MRKTLLTRMGYREGLTRIQLWLVNSLVQQTLFDIWDVILLEMEDTLAEGFRGHRQLPYAHWITFLIRKAVTVKSLIQQTIFDIWDVILLGMEDTLTEGFRGHRQLPYAHWITFLIRKAVTIKSLETMAEYTGVTTEFPPCNLTQMLYHSTMRTPSQPRRCPEVPETTT